MSKRGCDLFGEYMAVIFADVNLRQLRTARHVIAIREKAQDEAIGQFARGSRASTRGSEQCDVGTLSCQAHNPGGNLLAAHTLGRRLTRACPA
jgi:hypothetical protein